MLHEISLLLEISQPGNHHVGEILLHGGSRVISDSLAPVKADVTLGASFGAFDEIIHFLNRAGERKGFFNDQRLADFINSHCRERLVHRAFVWIQMNADKVERIPNFRRIKNRLRTRSDMRPWNDPDSDQMLGIFRADGGGQLVHQSLGDFNLRALAGIKRQT